MTKIFKFSMISLVVILAIVGASIAVCLPSILLGLPAAQKAREVARREQIKKNLKQIGLALHNYQIEATPAIAPDNK